MKRLLTFLVIVVATAAMARADRGGYTLHRADINIVAHENGCWDVTETLNVEYFERRHGIYKYIPAAFHYAFKDADGVWDEKTYKNRIKNVTVKGAMYSVDTDDTAAENTIIKIGSPHSEVFGDQQYIISYTVQYLDDRSKAEDFINHSVWGDGWNTEVDTLTFRIKFDKPLPATFASDLHLYSGRRGSTANLDSVAVNFDPASNVLSGSVMNMRPNHAITISARLPQGYWNAEAKNTILFYICVAAMVIAAIGFLYRIFTLKRRDIIPVVSFYPPEGMSSAEVGTIIDGTVDPKDMASLIPWLAHRGHIKVEEIPDKRGRTGKHADLRLTKMIPLTPKSPAYQHLFMSAIFGGKKQIVLSELGDRHYEMEAAKKSLDKTFTGKKALNEDDSTSGYWWVALLVAELCAFTTGHYADWFNTDLALFGGFFAVAPAILIGVLRFAGAPAAIMRATWVKVLITLGYLLLAVASLALTWVCVDGEMCIPSLWAMVGSAVVMALSYLNNRRMLDTDYRVRVMGELFGLKKFIETAEADRLKMLVDENPSYFYEVLPFAMVFGLSDKWSHLFDSIEMKRPDWYVPSPGTTYATTSLFTHNLSHSMSNSIASAVASASVDTTSSESSGGWSGGGSSFSGGGGGGGGGGSW